MTREGKEMQSREEIQEKKETARKWFEPEPERRICLTGYSESRSRRVSDDVLNIAQQIVQPSRIFNNFGGS